MLGKLQAAQFQIKTATFLIFEFKRAVLNQHPKHNKQTTRHCEMAILGPLGIELLDVIGVQISNFCVPAIGENAVDESAVIRAASKADFVEWRVGVCLIA